MANQSKSALALAQIPHGKTIIDREDLSFTSRDDRDLLRNWHVPHDPNGCWHAGIDIGVQHFAEIAALSEADEFQACCAIEFAFNEPGWKSGGWGIESGFSKAVAAAAIVGLRALRAGAAPYDRDLEMKRLEAEDNDT